MLPREILDGRSITLNNDRDLGFISGKDDRVVVIGVESGCGLGGYLGKDMTLLLLLMGDLLHGSRDLLSDSGAGNYSSCGGEITAGGGGGGGRVVGMEFVVHLWSMGEGDHDEGTEDGKGGAHEA